MRAAGFDLGQTLFLLLVGELQAFQFLIGTREIVLADGAFALDIFERGAKIFAAVFDGAQE